MDRGLGRGSGASHDRPAQPPPPRSEDRQAQPAVSVARTTSRHCPGFSIAKGRLAWATPPGQGGEGSRVQIVAWSGDEVGSTESVRSRTRSSSTEARAHRHLGSLSGTPMHGVASRGMVWPYRATQQVGRRDGAHCRPRPGRASGHRRFTFPEPDRAQSRPARSSRSRSRRSGLGRPFRSVRSTCLRSAGLLEADAKFIEPGTAPASGPNRRPKPDQPASAGASIRKAPRLTLRGGATFYDNGTTAMRLPRGTTW